MKIRFNLKLIGIVLGSMILLGGVAYGIHYVQVGRNARGLLTQAAHAEENGDFDQASRFLSRYLLLVPADTRERANFGILLEKVATARKSGADLQRVCSVYEEVVRREPGRADIRLRLATLETELRIVDSARAHIEILMKDSPDKESSEFGTLEGLLGRCYEARRTAEDDERAAEYFNKSIQHNPDQVDGYVYLAYLLRRIKKPQPQRADEIMRLMVERNSATDLGKQAYVERGRYTLAFYRTLSRNNPDSCAAIVLQAQPLAAFVYLSYCSATPDVRDNVLTALNKWGNDPGVLLLAGELALEDRDFNRARKYLRHGLAQDGQLSNGSFYLAWARVALAEAAERTDVAAVRALEQEAIDQLRAGLKQDQKPPHQADLLRPLVNVLFKQKEMAKVREIQPALRKALPADDVAMIEAQTLALEGNWPAASTVLEQLRTRLIRSESTAQRAEACLLLGECYTQLKEDRKALDLYNEAKRLVPDGQSGLQARLRVAAALLDSPGRLDDAISEYEQILRLGNAPPDTVLRLARLLIVQNLNRPISARRWDKVHAVLDEAARLRPGEVAVVILRAEALVEQSSDKVADARALLEKERDRQPRLLAPRLALAILLSQNGAAKEAVGVLDEAEKACGDSAEIRLGRLRVLEGLSATDAVAPRAKVTKDLEGLPEPDRIRLTRALAQDLVRSGKPKEALQLLLKNVPTDLADYIFLFDIALAAGDGEALVRATEGIRRIEPNGALGRYVDASRLLWQASQPGGDLRVLVKARKLLEETDRLRPDWSRVSICRARIDELEGNPDAAIENYRSAIRLGERGPETVRILARLLYQRQRYREADDAIQQLQALTPLSGDLEKMAAEVSLQRSDFDGALRQARLAVHSDSDNARDLIWLSQILWAAGKTPEEKSEAGKLLQLAVQKHGDQPEPWVFLVQYLVRVNKTAEAEAVVTKVAGSKLPPGDITLTQARCRELLGQGDQAARLFEEAVAARPEEVKVRRAAVDFYLRADQPRRGLKHLRWLLDATGKDVSAEEKARSRRALALGLANGGTYDEFRQAENLLKVPADREDQALANLRTLAVVQMGRDFARPEAIRTFDELQQRQGSRTDARTAADRFYLARLHEADGNWTRAREVYQEAIKQDKNNLIYWSACTQGLLRHGQMKEAVIASQRLAEIAPDSLECVAVKARLLLARSTKARAPQTNEEAYGQAVQEVRTFADKEGSTRGATVQRCRISAAVLEDLIKDFPDFSKQGGEAAELLLRRCPENRLVLIDFLGRQQRVQEALDEWQGARRTFSMQDLAAAGGNMLRCEKALPQHFATIQTWLRDQIRQTPTSAVLHEALAVTLEYQGEYEQAVAAYRRALDLDGGRVVALNNLAYLLALRPTPNGLAESSRLVDLLTRMVGPVAALRDTRAMALLTQGRQGEAIAELEQALKQQPQHALLHFHLAQAYQAAGRQEAAAQAWKEAAALGLSRGTLHPLDRAVWLRLESQLTAAR